MDRYSIKIIEVLRKDVKLSKIVEYTCIQIFKKLNMTNSLTVNEK